MRLEALSYIACSVCKHELTLETPTQQDGDQIMTGSLTCPSCSSTYPIIRGVPRLFQTDGQDVDLDTGTAYAGYFKEVLSNTPEDEARLYGLTVQEELADFRAKSHLTSMDELHSRVFLDAGCGVGRIDGLLAEHCQTVVALDITPAVERAFQATRHLPNVHIIQGNMVTLPIQTGKCDFVWCDGALPYVSDFDTSLRELLRARTSDGSLYAWCYDPAIKLKERIGRFFHQTHLPLRLRLVIMQVIAVIMMLVGSLLRRKNMLPLVPGYAQGILDWSLAAKVNHVSESQIRAVLNNLNADVRIIVQKHHVDLYINLLP